MFFIAFKCGIMFSSAWAYPTTFLFVSAFHLSYNMLLNQMRSEDGDPEKLLRHSFYQFQADRSLPDLEVC
jgi:superfamily II RNA helicase